MKLEQQLLLTQTDRGTPCGDLLRSYWQPIAIAEECTAGGAPMPITLFGEDLVLFRDKQNRVGLLERRCPHRGVDLCYGRVETAGLRCIYHGWLFNTAGACLDQPGVKLKPGAQVGAPAQAYPCHEAGGLIFAYLGGGEVPLFPNYEFLDTEPHERVVLRVLHRCNYLQAIEGNLDQVHVSFLHRMEMSDYAESDFIEMLDGTTKPAFEMLSEDTTPDIDVERTNFGMREVVSRAAPDGIYLKVENYVLPGFAAVPGPTHAHRGYLVNWHVPIDDRSHWKYMIVFQKGGTDQPRMLSALVPNPEDGPSFIPDRVGERFLQDRGAMENGKSYAGLGAAFSFHDLVITEAQGEIYDRTLENMRGEDLAIGLLRRTLLAAIAEKQAGKDPPHVVRTPEDNFFPELRIVAEVVPEGTDLKAHVHQAVERSRAAMTGAAPPAMAAA